MKKFELLTGINNIGSELLELYEEYSDLPENSTLKPILEYYAENKLKTPIPLSQVINRKDLRNQLENLKRFQFSDDAQFKHAIEFVHEILRIDENMEVYCTFDENSKDIMEGGSINIVRNIYLTQHYMKKLFQNVDDRFFIKNTSTFPKQFVDFYMIHNANLYLSNFESRDYCTCWVDDKCKYFQYNDKVTNMSDDKTSGYYFKIYFKIKLKALDEKSLTDVGIMLAKMPLFA